MKPEDVARLLGKVSRIVDEQWKALGPEKRKRICDNILERSRKRKGFPRGPESGPPNR